MFLRSAALLALALLAPAVSAQDQAPPTLWLKGHIDTVEGQNGNKVVVEWTLNYAPADFAASFVVQSVEEDPVTAVSGVDFVPVPPTRIDIPAGQTSGSFKVTIIDDDVVEGRGFEYFKLRYSDVTPGMQMGYLETRIGIRSDDLPPLPLMASDDYVTHVVGWGGSFSPAENDVWDPDLYFQDETLLALTVLDEPAHGTLVRHLPDNAQSYFGYSPDAGFAGRDQFDYRLCKTYVDECIEATVYIDVVLVDPVTMSYHGGGRSGGAAVTLTPARPLDGARYVTSALAGSQRMDFSMSVDTTPHLAWDGAAGRDFETRTLPASPAGQTRTWRIVAEATGDAYQMFDMRIGVDANGDGQPNPGEERCEGIWTWASLVACRIELEVGDQPVTYWVTGHSREDAPQSRSVDVYAIRMDAASRAFVATGPSTTLEGDEARLELSWLDGTTVGKRIGYVRIEDDTGVLGEFRVEPYAGGGTLMLMPDASTDVTLSTATGLGAEERSLFFDVPAGATSLTLTVTGDRPVDVALHRTIDSDSDVGIPEQMAPAGTVWTRTVAGQPSAITVAAPGLGRWYAFVRNTVGTPTRVSLRPTVQGNGPTTRPGSYYNPDRPGHGLLLYPAGNQWAGLWYTYDGVGRPTWYYLQGPKPGPNGLWSAPIFRDSWDGTKATHTQVGEFVLSPTLDDTFHISYRIDGWHGSQRLEALGTGCPSANGDTIDISSHWFDPARAGNGYSVQTWDSGYQFIAAFGYDRQGYPLFLAAERADLGGDVAELALEYLDASCPTCNYVTPERMPAGILRRTLVDGQLSEITLEVDYPEVAPFTGQRTYTVTDRVQLLGGPGTTQGCD